SACYRFTSAEIDTLDLATAALQELCIAAVDEVIRRNLFSRLGIPPAAEPLIRSSWDRDEPTLYGRFDLAWNGSGAPKLLEYNADTPTALLETAVIQWFWLKDRYPDADQFNSIHEKLIEGWRTWPAPQESLIHFACASGSDEDLGTLEYLRDTAIQAGFATERLFMEEIGWDGACFVDLANRPIGRCFKLYPWEWLLQEGFGGQIPRAGVNWVEPVWKLVLSSKGILPILREMAPNHPNLLEASFGELAGDYVRKPLFSREGENILIRRGGVTSETDGWYGREGYVFQRYCRVPDFGGNFPVIGSWVIAGEPAGIGIREDASEITSNASRFVPHCFE
ncbi:MAG TPA: glutathionylspermidine synthase family protein, partial [Anaerolineaceae bacterium]